MIDDGAPKSGNIRYIVIIQALKWQQNWQQSGNRVATCWAGRFGLVCRRATAFWIYLDLARFIGFGSETNLTTNKHESEKD
jgi:hypothetical protein